MGTTAIRIELDSVVAERKRQARELPAGVRRLDADIKDTKARSMLAVEASKTCLTDIYIRRERAVGVHEFVPPAVRAEPPGDVTGRERGAEVGRVARRVAAREAARLVTAGRRYAAALPLPRTHATSARSGWCLFSTASGPAHGVPSPAAVRSDAARGRSPNLGTPDVGSGPNARESSCHSPVNPRE